MCKSLLLILIRLPIAIGWSCKVTESLVRETVRPSVRDSSVPSLQKVNMNLF